MTGRWLAALAIAAALGAAPDRESDYSARLRRLVESSAMLDRQLDLKTGGYDTIAARLWLGKELDWCSRRLDVLLDEPWGDMFWMFPVTAVAYLDRGQLTEPVRRKLKQAWRTYMPFRGDTENHWLLYYTSLYLMAQMWPDATGADWYTGKSSAENRREAEGFLLHWMELTTTIGQGEYDCTHYIGVYLLPLSYLAAWSEDPVMRRRARLMLDWVIADYAAENLDGIYVGAHARTDDRQVREKWAGVSSDFGWLLFGLGYPQPNYSGYALYYAVASGYQPPPVLDGIARDRSKDILHRELKRTRNRWRFHERKNGPVYKTTYLRKDYAVSSDQGGVLQPIQQHSWDLTWRLEDPRGVENTIFSLHPYSSVRELQTYFTMRPDVAVDQVVRSKRSYDSPDKFLGGSPYEQIVQDLDTVVALYDIPPGTRFPHINGFFSKDLRELEEHSSGWIFAMGGECYIAYRPLAPYRWESLENGSRRLVSPHLKNGTILQAASRQEYPNLTAFRDAVLALPLRVKREPTPEVDLRSLRGRRIQARHGARALIDGQPVRYEDWKLFDSDYLQSEAGSRRLTMRYGGRTRTIDLGTLEVTEGFRP